MSLSAVNGHDPGGAGGWLRNLSPGPPLDQVSAGEQGRAGEPGEESDQSSRPLSGQETIRLVRVPGPRPGSSSPFCGEATAESWFSAAAVHPVAGGGSSRVLVWLGRVGLSQSQKDQVQGERQQPRCGRFAQNPSVPVGLPSPWAPREEGLEAGILPVTPEPPTPPPRPASLAPLCLLFILPPPVRPLVTGFGAHPKPG